MDPEIRFCTSADGTRISYATYGRLGNVPVLTVSGWAFSQEVSWRTPPVRQFIERLAAGSGVIGYDRRGTGRSSREAPELSNDTEVADIEAVLESVGIETVDVFAYDSNPAVPFVARHPERVRRLVLYGASFEPRPYQRAIPMIRNDAALGRRAIASVLYPQGPIELQKLWSNAVRDGMSQETHLRYMEHDSRLDLRETARNIKVPTLVISAAKSNLTPREAEDAALLLADVRMVSFVGEEHWYTDPDAMLAPVLEFLGHGAVLAEQSGGTAIILFADIADSTALTERLGDAAFREKARELDDVLRRVIAANGGQPVEGKLLGDGVLATFGAAREAIAAATDMHREVEYRGLQLHVGIHAGDVIREEDNVYGGAVNIASRVSGEAAPGETLVSQTVRDLARTSAGVSFTDRGERDLKGVSEPVRLFAVRSE